MTTTEKVKESLYIKTPETCEILGIDRHTLYKWIKSNQVKTLKLGGKQHHYRFLRSYVKNLSSIPEASGAKKTSESRYKKSSAS